MPGYVAISGWTPVRLGEVAVVQTGIAKHSRPVPDAIERPYLRVANVQDGHLDLSAVKTIAIAPADVPRYELRSGDVLMTEGGDFDKLGRGTVWRAEIPGCLHQNHVFAVRPDTSRLMPEFLAAWTTSRKGRHYFASSSKQTTNLASINSTQLKRALILLPPVEEQGRIVGLLSALDARMEGLKKLGKVKRRFRRGLIQRMFQGGASLASWRIATLNDFLVELRERSENGNHSVLSCTKRGIIPQQERFARRLASANTQRYKVVRRGDFVYDPMLLWDGSYGFYEKEDAGIVSPAYAVLRPKRPDRVAFLRALLETPRVRHAFKVISKGTNQRRRKAEVRDFLSIGVFAPSDEMEFGRIGSLSDLLARDIELTERLVQALGREKRALLDKLLSGELRLEAK